MLEVAQRAGNVFARRADELADLLMRHAEAEAPSAALRGLPPVAPIQQQTGKLFGRCGREPYGAPLTAVLGDGAAKLSNHHRVRFGMAGKKVKKIAPSDVGHLRRVERLSRHVIGA